MAVFAAIQALLQEGDECLLIGPSWMSYEPCVAFAGGSVAWGKVDDNFMPLNIAESITPKTRLIIVNSPSNPTGSVFDRQVLEEIRDLAVDHNLFVISDEIYEKIGSMPGMEDRTVTINGFYKAYAMTGWRLGYLTGPQEIMKWVTRLLSLRLPGYYICAARRSCRDAGAAGRGRFHGDGVSGAPGYAGRGPGGFGNTLQCAWGRLLCFPGCIQVRRRGRVH
jgi:aspartate/methionine/tyrosine aminotransferase